MDRLFLVFILFQFFSPLFVFCCDCCEALHTHIGIGMGMGLGMGMDVGEASSFNYGLIVYAHVILQIH